MVGRTGCARASDAPTDASPAFASTRRLRAHAALRAHGNEALSAGSARVITFAGVVVTVVLGIWLRVERRQCQTAAASPSAPNATRSRPATRLKPSDSLEAGASACCGMPTGSVARPCFDRIASCKRSAAVTLAAATAVVGSDAARDTTFASTHSARARSVRDPRGGDGAARRSEPVALRTGCVEGVRRTTAAGRAGALPWSAA